ncbi:MAG: hypothetical protein LBI74_08585 [Synergistaceae bacterium]|nr:hypothetical protein [Synergistaceae bacterium]
MTLRKILKLSFALASVMLASGLCEAALPSLPEIDGWECGELRSTDFNAVSGNQGIWLERDYRSPSRVPIKAVLMAGKGPGELGALQPGIDASTALYGDGGTFRTLVTEGFPSILENRPILGLSLSVNLGGATATFESSAFALAEDDFIEAASVIIRSIKENSLTDRGDG